MAATVNIQETNGSAPGTPTGNITNSNYGSIDAVNLDPVANPIVPGDNSFQKYHRWHVVTMGGSASVRNLRFFADQAPAANTTHLFNGHTTQATYDATVITAYATPDRDVDLTPNTVPTTPPASANIGIGTSLTGQITTDNQFSDYLVHMIDTQVAAVAGSLLELSYRFDEIA